MKRITQLGKMKPRNLIAIGLCVCAAVAFGIFYWTGCATAQDMDILSDNSCVLIAGVWVCW